MILGSHFSRLDPDPKYKNWALVVSITSKNDLIKFNKNICNPKVGIVV